MGDESGRVYDGNDVWQSKLSHIELSLKVGRYRSRNGIERISQLQLNLSLHAKTPKNTKPNHQLTYSRLLLLLLWGTRYFRRSFLDTAMTNVDLLLLVLGHLLQPTVKLQNHFKKNSPEWSGVMCHCHFHESCPGVDQNLLHCVVCFFVPNCCQMNNLQGRFLLLTQGYFDWGGALLEDFPLCHTDLQNQIRRMIFLVFFCRK